MNNKDNLNDYFSNISEFTAIAKSHLFSNNFDEFEVWFEKLYKKDKRALFMLMRDNYKKFNDEQISFAENMFNKKMS